MRPIDMGYAELSHTEHPDHLTTTGRADRTARRDMVRLHRGVFADPRVALTHTDRIRAGHLSAGPGSVVAGLSAQFLHGVAYPVLDGDVEIIRDLRGQGRRRPGVRIMRTDQLGPGDIVDRAGMPVTSPVRTAFDLGRRRPDLLALGHLDDMARTVPLDISALWAYTRDHTHTAGVRQLRELVGLIDPAAESPGESWTRLIMHRRGLPRPDSQIEVFDECGALIGRFDLGYRRYKIGVDYDGVEFHSSDEQRAHDARRDNGLRRRGWIPLRTTAAALSDNPSAEMAKIESALALRGHRM
ncbi:hypothetical protein [Williamsia deligens]|uniref:Transcriptional regulator, AbiEi antitoxin, Type IV TA system n=1 Tax=Williamsia deligens TaxID=321325 RepID=A0ABW3GE39_9NOCA|nr:hypothetical protein [Williamsia deligens]